MKPLKGDIQLLGTVTVFDIGTVGNYDVRLTYEVAPDGSLGPMYLVMDRWTLGFSGEPSKKAFLYDGAETSHSTAHS